ncbi:hypothetical protein K461DRAFT_230689 [Myriangium duriaei CBS 260.36]|uniref:Pre-rRNA-processing protein n=1 Tax=Myriangium duriaei CBS 260.36 TaxID=1168546 RepID=A0A9P4ITX2_9PEZI|nr:hypothetical protein K461DRAFT_230689 [Myriangium duriaei CBS 260.36]
MGGSSTKRKKEKAADFKKPKLKVGKTKPKASNATSTSFQARSIVLGQQSLTTAAPNAVTQFSHSLSLLTSKSDAQRREALASLTNTLTSHPGAAPPHPPVTIILKARPLLIDSSRSVRAGALSLLRALSPTEIDAHASDILIYAHIGLTHMAADIRTATLDTLEWLLGVAGEATVSAAGGWTGTLRRLTNVLGWGNKTAAEEAKTKGWTAATRTKLDDAKLRSKQIGVLALLLETGLTTEKVALNRATAARACCFPLWDVAAHRIPVRPDPYGYLGLFAEQAGSASSNSTDATQNSSGNIGVDNHFEEGIRRGLVEARKEGGELGRAAKSVERALAGLEKS